MLTVEDIEVRYQGASSAVRGVSLSVPDRSVVALLGANGAGKTTILRAIGGLLRFHGASVTRGAIIFDGQRIEGRDANQIVRLGIAQALEGRRLFANLSVEENLRAGAITSRNAAATSRAYDRVMALFPVLGERRRQMAGYLSGGEQQMCAMGRALMAKPKLLMLDEPSLGLAPILARSVLRTVRQIADRGTTVLLVEQNARQALAIAHRAYVIEVGKIVLEGDAAELARDERVQKAYLGGFEAVATEGTGEVDRPPPWSPHRGTQCPRASVTRGRRPE